MKRSLLFLVLLCGCGEDLPKDPETRHAEVAKQIYYTSRPEQGMIVIWLTDGSSKYSRTERMLIGIEEVQKKYHIKSALPITRWESSGAETESVILFVEPLEKEKN